MPERYQPIPLEVDIQHTRWLLAAWEPVPPPPTPDRERLLLAAPAPRLLLAVGSSGLEPAHLEPLTPRSGIIFTAPSAEAVPAAETPAEPPDAFTRRLDGLWFRLEQIIRGRWAGEVDTYELDNLVQAGLVHLWEAYTREPEKFEARGDGYWYAAAKYGAKRERFREFRQRFKQQGTGSSRQRRHVEVVVSAGDALATRRAADRAEQDEPDETLLDTATIYSHDTAAICAADRRIDVPLLERRIYAGTHPVDHPLIDRILGYMREGRSVLEMARLEQVPPATIRCTIRRIRQACGAAQSAKANKRRDYGDSKDAHIRELWQRGCRGPEIARLTGTGNRFVYGRLRAMALG